MNKEEIKLLIQKYFADQCSPRELEMVKELLNSGQYQDQWSEALDEAAVDHFLDPESSPFQQKASLFQKIELTLDRERKITAPRPGISSNLLKIAAAISLVIIGTIVYFIWQKSNIPAPITYQTYQTGDDEWRKIKLSDGTSIWLNDNTTLKIPEQFQRNTREVYLSGEAFFHVQTDSLKPFIVHTQDVQTSVLGTSFNINTFQKKVQVTVATGKVRVTHVDSLTNHPRTLALLTPNKQLTYHHKDQDYLVEEVDASMLIQWKKDSLEFKKTSMDEVTQILENYFGVTFQKENNAIDHCLLTASFRRNDSLEEVLKSIKTVSNIDFHIEGHQVFLSGTGCPAP